MVKLMGRQRGKTREEHRFTNPLGHADDKYGNGPQIQDRQEGPLPRDHLPTWPQALERGLTDLGSEVMRRRGGS
jgi:hypothetical protein